MAKRARKGTAGTPSEIPSRPKSPPSQKQGQQPPRKPLQAPKSDPPPLPSPGKSKPRPALKTAFKSKPSPRSKDSSPSFLKAESFGKKIRAVALSPDGKPLKKASGQAVTYGIQSESRGRKEIHPIAMPPQSFRKHDLEALDKLLKTSADAQGKPIPSLAFFQVTIPGEFEATPTGKVKRKEIQAGPLKGKRVPIQKTRLQFDPPDKSDAWRQLYYEGGEFSHAIHKNLQKRNTYEIVKSSLLGKEGFTKFSDAHSRFVGGFVTKNVHLRGRTLTEALRQIQVPVSAKWLKKNKVVVDKFRERQIGNITVDGSVKVKTTEAGERVEKNIPVKVSVRYLADITNEVGRAIRQRLADQGSTFTTPRELALIEAGAWRKLKALRGGLRAQRAQRELQRLTQPGLSPKSAKLSRAIKQVAKGTLKPGDFPLSTPDDVSVNLRFSFYRDPLAKAPTKGRKKRNQK